jgi:hypothetical protein
MLRRIAWLFAAVLGSLASTAHAFTPETGFYWNPAEPGSGIAIEIQDNILFLAGYVYDTQGNATWVTSAGAIGGNSTYNGTLDQFRGGQCIGCAYTANFRTGSAGPVAINWSTETRATFTWGGRTFPIERFNYALGDKQQIMLGEWQVVLDLYGRSADYNAYPFYGEVMIVDLINRTPEPDQFQGCRPVNSLNGFCSSAALAAHDLAGTFNTTTGKHVIVITDGMTNNVKTFFAYYVTVGTEQFDGVFEICNQGQCGAANATTYPVRGFRSASNHFVQTGSGPSAETKSAGAAPRGLAERIREANGGVMPQGMSAAEAKAKYGIDLDVLGPEAKRLTESM